MSTWPDVEALVALFGTLTRSRDERRDAQTLVQGRFYCARSREDHLELFLEGSAEEFAPHARGAYFDFGEYAEAASGRRFTALVLRSPASGGGVRLAAHAAYEVVRAYATNASLESREAAEVLAPFAELLQARQILGATEQAGLLGELLLLERLVAHEVEAGGAPGSRALDAWCGWSGARRDFATTGIGVECKATTQGRRVHRITTMEQLLPSVDAPDERVYLWSIGAKPDRSAALRLVDIVERLETTLTAVRVSAFLDRLEQAGFASDSRARYRLEPAFTVDLEGRMYAVDQACHVLRPTDFVGGGPPSGVTRIAYDLDVSGWTPLARQEERRVMRGLIGAVS